MTRYPTFDVLWGALRSAVHLRSDAAFSKVVWDCEHPYEVQHLVERVEVPIEHTVFLALVDDILLTLKESP